MARQPRFVLVGHPQHIIVRGNNRQAIFLRNEDYQFYLEKLQAACSEHQCDLHAYVLMTNHVHLLITPWKEDGISKTMQMLGRYYVQYFNFVHRRTGTLWEGRYRAGLIDSENYALICYRYIELNPVRTVGLVDHPGEYPWSSYRHNAIGEQNQLVVHHPIYDALGSTDTDRQAAYKELFQSHIPSRTLEALRAATNKAWILGDSDFKGKIGEMVDRPTSPKARGGDRRSKIFRREE